MLDRTNHNHLHDATQARIGHNGAPGPIDSAKEAMAELGEYLKENPVVQSHAEAKQAGGWIERTRIALKTMEDERVELVAPLNEKLSTINGAYRVVRDPLTKLYDLLRARVTAYTRAEEAKRAAEAERLRQEAAEKERLAREAEANEAAAIAGAEVGELTDVGVATIEADAAFLDYSRTNREAQRAERNVNVRIGSVMGGRSLAARTETVLTIDDPQVLLTALGFLSERTADSLKTDARAFFKETGEWPDGITATKQRSI